MESSSIITLNAKSLHNNIEFLRKKFGKNVQISSVVKANAYGHGLEQMVPLLEKEQIDHFSVFDYSEGLRVHKSLSSPKSIMIMGWISDKNMKDVIQKGFEFFVPNTRRLHIALKYAKQLNIKAKIHLEAETGMNRSGLNIEQLESAISIINNNREYIDIIGFCSHLAGPESISNYLRIQKQLKRYKQMFNILENNGIKPKYKHIANSAAAFVYPNTRMDLVRIGIMQYGFWSSTETFVHYISKKEDKTNPLDRILSWKTQIMSIKEVKTGEFIGYGTSYLAQKDILAALIPIGYYNGYPRISNNGRVLVNGTRCGILGVVNMNMLIVDVSYVDSPKIGDEVVLIGSQGMLEISVSAFCDIHDQLNYEVLARLPMNIQRQIIS